MSGLRTLFFIAIAIAISFEQTSNLQNDFFSPSSLIDPNSSVEDLAQSVGDQALVTNISGPPCPSRRMYSRQTSGPICKPNAHLPGGQSNENIDDSSKKQPEGNPSKNLPYVPRDPCYAYADQNTLLTCAGPESIFVAVLSVARCVPGESNPEINVSIPPY